MNKIIENIKEKIKSSGNDAFFGGRSFIKWVILSVITGIVVGLFGSLFGHVLTFVNNLRADYPIITFGLPLGGLLIVFLIWLCKHENDKGTNGILSAVHSDVDIPFKVAPLIFINTTITHLFGGSSGREGAAVQLGGSIAESLSGLFRLQKEDRRVLIMCGMSAGFAALFGTPMAAAAFSLELFIVGTMPYGALMPCVFSAVTAKLIAGFLKVAPEVFPVKTEPGLDLSMMIKAAILAALTGLVAVLFCKVVHGAGKLSKRLIKNPYLRIFAGGCLILLLSAIIGTGEYLGSGMGIIEHIFHTGTIDWYAFLLKILFTAITLGVGYKGGEIVPSFTVGAAFGCAMSVLLGMPADLAAACGMVGAFCGVTNCPIASILIGIELFGGADTPYYLITAAVSMTVSGRTSLYSTQLYSDNTEVAFPYPLPDAKLNEK